MSSFLPSTDKLAQLAQRMAALGVQEAEPLPMLEGLRIRGDQGQNKVDAQLQFAVGLRAAAGIH